MCLYVYDVYVCMYMMHVYDLTWVSAGTHGMHVEIRGQPQMLVLTLDKWIQVFMFTQHALYTEPSPQPLSFLLLLLLLLLCVSIMCVLWVCIPEYICVGQMTALWRYFSLSTLLWAQGSNIGC